jgi:glycosyltransferase involved in cell wall biosynthesis/ubiquinone/menaquinone biosynthesis C-methylase UbiE
VSEPIDYLYVEPNLADIAFISSADLADTTERHKVDLRIGPITTLVKPLEELRRHGPVGGVVVGMERGWPGLAHLRFASKVLRLGHRVWFYWPLEQAVECIDRESLGSYRRLWAVVGAFRAKQKTSKMLRRHVDPLPALASRAYVALHDLIDNARPAPFEHLTRVPDGSVRLPGTGVYLRTDFWAQISSGGSYGHTCYVAKELAACTERFVCFMPRRYDLLDEFHLHQVVLESPSEVCTEETLLQANWHYLPIIKPALQALRPRYIYERHCLGNFVGATMSQQLGIPYILEYNGSEISMNNSFGGVRFRHEDVFLKAEEAAFRQATFISVVSEVLKQSLVERHVDPAKILVNPNGADPDAYAPPRPAVKREIRRELGWGDDERVIGFTGTFGGWHGVQVLAAAIPRICARAPKARFLLIGDGVNKPAVDQAVAEAALGDRVLCVGRVPQQQGARLLGACDIYVSPHNSHMVDSKFFGSPTKLFEYMAMGGGIVSSDLEQLGDVLAPGIRAVDVQRPGFQVTDERAVLCAPGALDEFVEGVVGLIDRPDVADALGRNARQAVVDVYSWRQHVANVWSFAIDRRQPAAAAGRHARELQRVATADTYKEEVQNQWNHNPVGTQYAKVTRAHSLEWFKEIEAHRYGVYAPWMPDVMEFDRHAGDDVLEIGGGVGTDLSQFARHGARVTDLDLSAGHLQLAQENFAARGLEGRFVHHDAETLPFDDESFDLVYSNGVLHHTPNTRQVVQEIRRVLRPGGRAIVMMYAENSLHYFKLAWNLGLEKERFTKLSMGDIMSRYVEITHNDARPLVKVYTARRLRALFDGFENRRIYKRQLIREELPPRLRWVSPAFAERLVGWNVIIKARKPARA